MFDLKLKSDYINWYLVELGERLRPHFTADKLEDLVREVESHLREASKRIEADGGTSPQMAQLAAIQAFGAPRRVARTYLSEADPRLFGVQPALVAVIAGLVAIACWDFGWMTLDTYFDNFGDTWQTLVAGGIGVVALTIVVLAIRAARRSLRIPILTAGMGTAIALVFLMSFWIVGSDKYSQGVSRFHLDRDATSMRKSLVALDNLEAYVNRGERQFAIALSAADISREFTDPKVAEREIGLERDSVRPAVVGLEVVPSAFVVPQEFVMAMVRGDVYSLESAPDWPSAKKAWAARPASVRARIVEARADLNGLLADVAAARNGRLFRFTPGLIWNAVGWTVSFSILLILLDWVAVLLSDRRQPWPGRILAMSTRG